MRAALHCNVSQDLTGSHRISRHAWRREHPQLTASFSEGLLQRTGSAFVADLVALLSPLPFNLSSSVPLHMFIAVDDPVAPAVFADSLVARYAAFQSLASCTARRH